MFIFHCYPCDPVENSVGFAFMEAVFANFVDVLFPGTISSVSALVST